METLKLPNCSRGLVIHSVSVIRMIIIESEMECEM